MVNLRNDYCGICHPKILEALTKKSCNFYTGYGMDNETALAETKIKKLINNDNAHVYFTVGGTSTNKIVIAHALPSYGCAIACDSGHINVHETGAIEATGHKVITVPNVYGKLTASGVEELVKSHPDFHMVKPGLVYISNSTGHPAFNSTFLILLPRNDKVIYWSILERRVTLVLPSSHCNSVIVMPPRNAIPFIQPFFHADGQAGKRFTNPLLE